MFPPNTGNNALNCPTELLAHCSFSATASLSNNNAARSKVRVDERDLFKRSNKAATQIAANAYEFLDGERVQDVLEERDDRFSIDLRHGADDVAGTFLAKSFQRSKGTIKTHQVPRNLRRNRAGVQEGKLPCGIPTKSLWKIAREDAVPRCLSPLTPLPLGKCQCERLGLQADKSPVLLHYPAPLQIGEGGTEIIDRPTTRKPCNLRKVIQLAGGAEQPERPEQHSRIFQQRRVGRTPPEKNPIDKLVIRGGCDGHIAEPGLTEQGCHLGKPAAQISRDGDDPRSADPARSA